MHKSNNLCQQFFLTGSPGHTAQSNSKWLLSQPSLWLVSTHTLDTKFIGNYLTAQSTAVYIIHVFTHRPDHEFFSIYMKYAYDLQSI